MPQDPKTEPRRAFKKPPPVPQLTGGVLTHARACANPQTRKAAKVQRSIRIRNTKGYI